MYTDLNTFEKYRKYGAHTALLLILANQLLSCDTTPRKVTVEKRTPVEVVIEAEDYTASSTQIQLATVDPNRKYIQSTEGGWIALDVEIPIAGRYKSEINISSRSGKDIICWIEDYFDNKDDRTYNITGSISVQSTSSNMSSVSKDGSPLNAGLHRMKVHFDGEVEIDWIKFSLLKEHKNSPAISTQKMTGDKWEIAWADEFDGSVIDTSKWTYDIGNWGWGNGESQYYTENRPENARVENGNLIIEGRKNDMGEEWTSARLTTRGKVSFLYGKIEFKAKVPHYRGNWAAGWTLGDDYVDELSWPYCGEIDILESVGYEMDDETGNGIAHASAHSAAYYFKLGNQPTNVTDIQNMNNEYHTYAVEWTPTYIKAFVDDQPYFEYTENGSEDSWPFDKPQNIILNLAIGGGWGGYYGIDESVNSQKMIVDYVRVYELR